ncbi:MAG: nucleotide exchange factor GrpE [Bacteroidales bacterium]|jgi:molecular chaperone GrpE|nr:nucleotide exchange factor GrpE [Bacteroidales bacterium]
MNRKKNTKDEQIEILNAEKTELNDRFLRLYSEFENYKKRTNKEKIDIIATASEKVILELLPIIDDFERAILHNKNIGENSVLKDGFELIYSKLLKLLIRFDVEEISAIGKSFDTDLHEAVTHFSAQTEEEKGKIVEVTQKGYKLKDKVIRFSKVVVAN